MQIALTDWLGEVRRDSQPRQPAVFFVPLARCQQQHRQLAMTRIPPKLFDDLEPVHLRHVEIEQDDAERIAAVASGDGIERLRSGLDADRRQPPLAQDVFEQPTIGRVVIHDQHGHAWRQLQIDARRTSSRRRRLRHRRRDWCQRHREMEGAADADGAVQPEASAHHRRRAASRSRGRGPCRRSCLVVDPSACLNGSKITRCLSFGMPMPLSATLM